MPVTGPGPEWKTAFGTAKDTGISKLPSHLFASTRPGWPPR